MISSDFHGRFASQKNLFFFFNFRLILYVCTSSSSRKSDYEFDDEGVLFQKIGE